MLRVEEVPDPHPGEGEVRIRVEAAGVHLIDGLIRRGEAPPGAAVRLPIVPGREVAGVVDETGPGVPERWLGRPVAAHLGLGGGYAEYALSPVEALHERPEGLDAEQTVAMIGTGRTAMAILEHAAPAAEDVVLVTAAAGGIGTLLIQALRATGATVVGAAGGERKIALVRALGASIAIDYTRPGWQDEVRTRLEDRALTLALDGVGGEIGRKALELLGVGGRLVMYGSASGRLTELSAGDLFTRGISASSAIGARIFQRPGGFRPLETRSLEAAASGSLKPVIGMRFPLERAGAAQQAIERRETVGKVVLHP